MAVTAEVAVAQVVGQDDDDVRLPGGARRLLGRREPGQVKDAARIRIKWRNPEFSVLRANVGARVDFWLLLWRGGHLVACISMCLRWVTDGMQSYGASFPAGRRRSAAAVILATARVARYHAETWGRAARLFPVARKRLSIDSPSLIKGAPRLLMIVPELRAIQERCRLSARRRDRAAVRPARCSAAPDSRGHQLLPALPASSRRRMSRFMSAAISLATCGRGWVALRRSRRLPPSSAASLGSRSRASRASAAATVRRRC